MNKNPDDMTQTELNDLFFILFDRCMSMNNKLVEEVARHEQTLVEAQKAYQELVEYIVEAQDAIMQLRTMVGGAQEVGAVPEVSAGGIILS